LCHEGFCTARFGDEEDMDARVFRKEAGVAGGTGGLANPVQETGFAFAGSEL
jgi:hypothetical protein